MNSGVLHTMQALATSLPTRKLEPQQVLFEAGAPGDCVFCVLSGEVEERWGDEPGERFGPGDVLGVGALVGENHRRHCTARAVVASELIEMSREQFLFAVQETPMFALELMAGLERRLRRREH